MTRALAMTAPRRPAVVTRSVPSSLLADLDGHPRVAMQILRHADSADAVEAVGARLRIFGRDELPATS